MIDHLLSLIERHKRWRGNECINLIPSENTVSPEVRALLSSDLGHRYTSRQGFYMGTRFIDEVERCGEKIARDVFRCETADLRPISGHIADWIFLGCFAEPKNRILCISPEDGGYPGFWEQGLSRQLRFGVIRFPFSKEEMNIRVDETADLILEEKPSVVVFGASLFLFPHPVEALSGAARSVGSHVGYDGSHVMGLVAGKRFQMPFKEGVHVLFGSTHKTLFGPQGGIILADKEHGGIMKSRIEPEFVDNAHWNRIAALTLALAEMKSFGERYAEQVIRNAQALATALDEEGFPVVCSDVGYTESHQVFLDYGGYKHGKVIARRLEAANVICDCGVRLGTCEVTRSGMKANEMQRIARFMTRVVLEGEAPRRVKEDSIKLAEEFSEVEYCFQ